MSTFCLFFFLHEDKIVQGVNERVLERPEQRKHSFVVIHCSRVNGDLNWEELLTLG